MRSCICTPSDHESVSGRHLECSCMYTGAEVSQLLYLPMKIVGEYADADVHAYCLQLY